MDDLEFVALLLLNDFHRDSNCLVLSENHKSGPFYEYFVKRQQSENKLPVFAVHDGGAEEEIMVSRIKKDPKWIGCEEITDLGLSREILTDYKSGTWINERSGSVQAHSPKKIDEKYKGSWVFPVDCIPPEKLNLSLNACMAGGFAMLSPQMFGAIGMAPAATSSNTSSGDGSYYGDSGSSTSFLHQIMVAVQALKTSGEFFAIPIFLTKVNKEMFGFAGVISKKQLDNPIPQQSLLCLDKFKFHSSFKIICDEKPEHNKKLTCTDGSILQILGLFFQTLAS